MGVDFLEVTGIDRCRQRIKVAIGLQNPFLQCLYGGIPVRNRERSGKRLAKVSGGGG